LDEGEEERGEERRGEEEGRREEANDDDHDARDHDHDARDHHHEVWIEFAEPAFAITPHQYVVLYDGDVCVASARIVSPGLTLHEEAEQTLG